MEDILASIKKVIAEEKELRTARGRSRPIEDEPLPEDVSGDDDVLELDEPLAPPADLGPPLIDEERCRAEPPGARAAADRRRDGARGAAGQPARGDGARDAAADAQAVARRASAADGRRACEAGDLADHRAARSRSCARAARFATPAS